MKTQWAQYYSELLLFRMSMIEQKVQIYRKMVISFCYQKQSLIFVVCKQFDDPLYGISGEKLPQNNRGFKNKL